MRESGFGFEPGKQACFTKGSTHPGVGTAGRHAGWDGEAIQNVNNAGDGFQVAPVNLEHPLVVLFKEAAAQRFTQPLLDYGFCRRIGSADEGLDGLFISKGQANVIEHFTQDAVGNRLGVHQDAVAIKND